MRHYLYLLIFALLTFVSCETELPEGEWNKEPPAPSVTYQLSIDKTTIVAKAEGSSETFSITSDDTWTATTDVSWVTLSATSGSGDKTITVTINLNSTTESRTGTITIKGSNSGTKTITVTQSGKSAVDTNGHEYVDLGLPSGLLWATCNVGASKPEDYGDYFAWGETTTKSTYDWSTYKYCKGSYDTMTKYNTSSSYGTVDNKTVLDLEDDAAHVNWGGSWRMPTKTEQDELIDTNNCTWTWTTQNGVKGYKVTSKKNNNSLFLPAAGYRDVSSLYDAGSYGYYWSSSLYASYTSYTSFACCLNFYSGHVGWNYYNRYDGLSVRPVCASSE